MTPHSSAPVVAGLDLSLTATGVAIFELDEPTALTVKSKGANADTLGMRNVRLSALAANIVTYVERADYVAVESPAYNQTGGSHHDRSGLWWLVVSKLVDRGIHVYEVTPTQVKKYATGRGNASKTEVITAVVKRYPQFSIANDNEADAVILAAFLRRALGHPVEESMPQVNTWALDKFTI